MGRGFFSPFVLFCFIFSIISFVCCCWFLFFRSLSLPSNCLESHSSSSSRVAVSMFRMIRMLILRCWWLLLLLLLLPPLRLWFLFLASFLPFFYCSLYIHSVLFLVYIYLWFDSNAHIHSFVGNNVKRIHETHTHSIIRIALLLFKYTLLILRVCTHKTLYTVHTRIHTWIFQEN